MKTFVNMLPQSCRRRNLVRSRLVEWVPVWMLVFAAAAFVSWTEHTRYETELSALRVKERRYAPVEKLNAELGTIRKQLTELQKQEAVAAELVNSQPVLSLVGVVSRSAGGCGGKLGVDKFTLGPITGSGVTSNRRTTPTANARRLLTLEGRSLDNLAVAKFVALLRQADVFLRVELKSSKEEPSAGDRGHAYLVECSL